MPHIKLHSEEHEGGGYLRRKSWVSESSIDM